MSDLYPATPVNIVESIPLPMTIAPISYSQEAIYTAVGDGVLIDATAAPVKSFALQVGGVDNVPAAWAVSLLGSLDGSKFTILLTHTRDNGDGGTVFTGPLDSPCRYFKVNVAVLTLAPATQMKINILGM
jgi:hypothetical protein